MLNDSALDAVFDERGCVWNAVQVLEVGVVFGEERCAGRVPVEGVDAEHVVACVDALWFGEGEGGTVFG